MTRSLSFGSYFRD